MSERWTHDASSSRATGADVCAYIGDLCAELGELAQRPGCRTLQYLLAMARVEAERLSKEMRSGERDVVATRTR